MLFFWWWILFVFLFVFLVAAWPTWPHSRQWGYYPTGSIGILLIVLLILLLLGALPRWGYPY